MSVSRPIGVQLVIFICSSVPVVLFDIPGISRFLNTLLLLVLIFALYNVNL